MNTIINQKNRNLNCNQQNIQEIMNDWGCTELEAMASIEMNCDSLDETKRAIQAAITYKRYLDVPLPGAIQYVKEFYKDDETDKDFILEEAKEMVESQAGQFVYEWDLLDDYEGMSEAEKENILFCN